MRIKHQSYFIVLYFTHELIVETKVECRWLTAAGSATVVLKFEEATEL